jgi:hypothetical protein
MLPSNLECIKACTSGIFLSELVTSSIETVLKAFMFIVLVVIATD